MVNLQETDENLMFRYREGEESAFTQLYGRYRARLYGYLRKRGLEGASLEDVFQNVWVRLHRARFRYDPRFKFSAWIFVIARSVMVDALRKEGRLKKSLESFKQLEESELSSTEASLEIPWQSLSEKDRELLEWRYEEEADFEEIAERLGVNPVSVRQRVSRALKKLRKEISKKDA